MIAGNGSPDYNDGPRSGGGQGKNMRVAFIGLAWHQKTGSSRFLTDLLEQHAHVERWEGEPGRGANWKWRAGFDENRYDIIIIWQLHEAFALLSGRHPNVIFVPMYDAMLWAGNLYWKPSFDHAKIICFSWALRREVMRRGAVHAGFQYFPDPSRHTMIEDFTTLRGFLWYRRRDIPPAIAFALCGDSQFDRFVIHDAPDPDHEMQEAEVRPSNFRRLDRTGWSADGAAYITALRDTNIFFAPRPLEGIGMSVLEAMASGHCVVAPDAPAMNEYISNGTNGLLYDPGRLTPLDFTAARAMGLRARETIERGYQRWLTSIPALLDFIATPTAAARRPPEPFIPVRNRFAPEIAPRQPGRKLVSVVTVCRDAAAVLDATLQSVLGQTGCDFESIVLDRGSGDASVDIIRRHAGRLAAWRSETDDGLADAMNAALALASGEWVLFMNAGDAFVSEDALRRMFAGVPIDAEIVHGHHIRRLADGAEDLRRTAEFETTWSRMRRGDLWLDWLAGIPAQNAIAVRRDLLVRLRFDTGYQVAALLELLFRARARGARFHNSDEIVSTETAGRLSPRPDAQYGMELARIVRAHGDAAAADRVQVLLDAAKAAPDPHGRIGQFARLALRMIGVLEKRSPALARGFERMVRGAPARLAARWLRRPGSRVNPDALPATADPRHPDAPCTVSAGSHHRPGGCAAQSAISPSVPSQAHGPTRQAAQ